MGYRLYIALIFMTISSHFAQNSNWVLFSNSEIGIIESSITSIVETKNGIIWIGTNGEGLFKYDWIIWSNYNKDNSSLPSNYITSLAVDSINSLWIGTFGDKGGLTKYDGENWDIFNIDGNVAYDIQVDNNGALWMGSYWNGLIEFDGDTTFTYFNSRNTNLHPIRDEIISINIQLDSVVYCGTELGGGAKFTIIDTMWTEYYPPQAPIDLVINSIIVDKDENIWFAGIQFISMIDSSLNWLIFDYDYTNNYDYYHDIVLSNNSLLFSSDRGLLELNYSNGEVWTKITPPTAELDSIGCDGLITDRFGNVWVGFKNGYLAIYNPDGITEVKKMQGYPPVEFSLSNNYPNPFNPSTTINYQLSKPGFVSLKVFDILGKKIAVLVNENKSAGFYGVSFDANNLPSGLYIYRMRVNDFVASKKMLLTK